MIRIGEYHNEYQERKRTLKALVDFIKQSHAPYPEWVMLLGGGNNFDAYNSLETEIEKYKLNEKKPYDIYFLEEIKKLLVPFVVEKEYERIEKLVLCSNLLKRFIPRILENPVSFYDVKSKINTIEQEIEKINKDFQKFKENDLEILKSVIGSKIDSFSEAEYKKVLKQMEESGLVVDGFLKEESKIKPEFIKFFSEFKVYEKVSNDILEIIHNLKEIEKCYE